jgi:hypothetical protein
MHECANCLDIGGKIIGGRARHVIEEAGPDQDAERGPVERYGCTHEVDSPDGILTVRTNIVTDDETGIGPPDECGMFQAELIDDGRNVIRPKLGFRIVFLRLGCFRHAVAAKIESHEVEFVRKLALVLFAPAKMVL